MPKIVISRAALPPITRLDFLKRFTFDERVAIEEAAKKDASVQVVKDSFMIANEIRLNDPETIAGVKMYVLKGLITEERKKEILK